MKNRRWKKAAALMIAGMIISAMGFGVSAEEGTKQAVITKKITKEANMYAPATSFSFMVTPGTAVSAGNGSEAIYSGPEGGVTAGEAVISAPAAEDIGVTEVIAGTSALNIDESKFTAPGIYRYLVTETSGAYDGMTYSAASKNFDVYVDSSLTVYAYTFVDPSAENGKDDGVFTNDYTGNDLTVRKIVSGVLGDRSKEFDFTITANGADGEWYYVTFSDGTTPITLKTGESQTIRLSADETATIFGLSETDGYVVAEADYSSDGYVTTIDGVQTNKAEGSIAEDQTIEVTNTKDTTAPTGIITDIAPYILMIAAAGIITAVFLRRKDPVK